MGRKKCLPFAIIYFVDYSHFFLETLETANEKKKEKKKGGKYKSSVAENKQRLVP